MANVRKLGYFKPIKPNTRTWDLKRRPRETKTRKENADGKALGKRIRSA